MRVPAGYVTGEPSIAGHAAGGRLALGIGGRAAAGRPADADRPGHALGLVAVHRAVHLVALAGRERELDRLARAGVDVAALDLVALAAALLDRERVRDLPVVRDLEGVGAGLGQRDGARVERVLLLGDLDRLDDRTAGGAALAAAAAAAAAGGEQEGRREQDQEAAPVRGTTSNAVRIPL